jgi:hypothetical protein
MLRTGPLFSNQALIPLLFSRKSVEPSVAPTYYPDLDRKEASSSYSYHAEAAGRSPPSSMPQLPPKPVDLYQAGQWHVPVLSSALEPASMTSGVKILPGAHATLPPQPILKTPPLMPKPLQSPVSSWTAPPLDDGRPSLPAKRSVVDHVYNSAMLLLDKDIVAANGRLESGSLLRQVAIPAELVDRFLAIAQPNSIKNLETCGILCGTLVGPMWPDVALYSFQKRSRLTPTCLLCRQRIAFMSPRS